ncbi:MAG: hypothetical protein RR319_01245 [Bacteroides sp.]
MKTEKQLHEEYIQEIIKSWKDERMLAYFSKMNSGLYELPNGGIFAFEKLKIEKQFYYPYHDSMDNSKSFDKANDLAEKAHNDTSVFIDKNMAWYKKFLDNFDEKINYRNKKMCLYRTSYGELEKMNLYEVVFLDNIQIEEESNCYLDLKKATEEEIAIIKGAYEKEYIKFSKRLASYLKRYGLSKIEATSYWADR